MRVLGLIPARGGSKGIPRKNLVKVAGKTLLERAIECAHGAKRLAGVLVSTDDEEIGVLALACGCTVLSRPADLALDTTPTIDVVRHAIERDKWIDAVFTIQPTNPLRLPEDIDGAIELLEQHPEADAVVGYSCVGERHPERMITIHDPYPFGKLYIDGESSYARRQDLPPVYMRNGAVYLTRVAAVVECQTLAGRVHLPYFIPPSRCWNIDEPWDIPIVEALLKWNSESAQAT